MVVHSCCFLVCAGVLIIGGVFFYMWAVLIYSAEWILFSLGVLVFLPTAVQVTIICTLFVMWRVCGNICMRVRYHSLAVILRVNTCGHESIQWINSVFDAKELQNHKLGSFHFFFCKGHMDAVICVEELLYSVLYRDLWPTRDLWVSSSLHIQLDAYMYTYTSHPSSLFSSHCFPIGMGDAYNDTMVCLLLFYVLATSKIISGHVLTVWTHGDFIVLPHWETRPWPDILHSHIILTLSQPVLAPS